ncbi:hypothetical protein QFC24_001142 [Naganishia onofrii]|uniref:Uncharacterized protein n=1 Tax=Naganishia onofrii TaxID=1851511 RepID=A0ACC2XV61_9TREE|nr:hypothetical protein QFC24_001142 [Naganishia onofrii]
MANYPSLHHVLSSAPPSPAIPDPVPENIAEDPAYDPELTSPSAQTTAAQLSSVREVSMVEHGIERVGIRFSPALQMQRIEWALDVLRKEGVRSVLDVGCGEGDLLRVLCEPAATVPEDPIKAVQEHNGNAEDVGDDEEDMEKEDEDHNYNRRNTRELFLHRVGGLDIDPTVIPEAVKAIAPPPEREQEQNHDLFGEEYVVPRWQRLEAEIWQGDLAKHNRRLEGFEAIVALEVVEHLNGPSFQIFPQMVFGTFRPRIVLISTPNFEFNAKFPRSNDPEHSHSHGQKGFLDPTGRTDRVFRHSDHKFEMNEREFQRWCDAAEDWGYTATIGGVGISSHPSYHDDDPSRPLYATQTAIFRLGGQPTRSPRSVRTSELPFMPGSGEKIHAHRLAARHIHEPRGAGAGFKNGKQMRPASDEQIRKIVKETMQRWRAPEVVVSALWADPTVAKACAGSKRTLCRAVGGFGDCPGATGRAGDLPDWEVFWPEGPSGMLTIRWKEYPEEPVEEPWGASHAPEVEMKTDGW